MDSGRDENMADDRTTDSGSSMNVDDAEARQRERHRLDQAVLRAVQEAVRDALIMHKKMGNPVATWKDGQVVWVQPEDIVIFDLPEIDEEKNG
jgi:hypothetical protein